MHKKNNTSKTQQKAASKKPQATTTSIAKPVLPEKKIAESKKRPREEESIAEAPKAKVAKKDQTSSIKVSAGFQWDDAPATQDDTKTEQSDEDNVADEEASTSNRNKNLKRKEAKITERIIAQREQELLQNVVPESDEDFERVIVASPNSSYLWIQYMAFKLGLTDVDGARKTAERALKAISIREDTEKFNVYAALMNLESKFGNEASQRAAFERARQYCRPKPVYLHQAKIYEQNNDTKVTEEWFKKTCKKFNKSRKSWEAFELFYLRQGNTKAANEVLERSLLSLPKEKHVKAITHFALLHYKHGSIVQGNKLFESIVQSYPSRTDIWSMFIDAELNASRIDQVRSLFTRVVALKLSTKKMKNFLQRFLKFEQKHGSEENQEHVKQLARDYISAKTN